MITLHADPGADAGGNGTTNALTGANCAYKGIGPAIVALEASGPSARGDAVTLKLWNQTGIADTDAVGTLNQFDVSTTAANYLQIEGATALTGVFDESLWYMEVTNRNGIYNNVTNHLRIVNVQVRIISNDGGGHVGLKTTNANQAAADIDNRVENYILECVGSNIASSLGTNPRPTGGTIATSKLWNGLVYGFAQGVASDEVATRVGNTLAVDCTFGFVADTAFRVDNCAAVSCPSNGFTGTFHASSTNNASEDGTAPNTNEQTGTPAFVRRGSRNYLHTSADTVLKNNGATDPLGVSSTDIRGFTRSTWDIGPFESVTGSAALTGTVTASITEADIVAGGKTEIVTLTNDTVVPPTTRAAFLLGTATSTTTAPGRQANGDITVTFPTTPKAGMFGVIVVYLDAGDASTPANWTEIAGSPFGSATPKMCVFVKLLDGTESNPVTTISGSSGTLSNCAVMALYAGVGATGAIGTASAGTGTPMTAGAITTTKANALVLGLCGRGDNEASSTQTFGASATGVAERVDAGTNAGDDSQCSIYDKFFSTSGTSSGNGSAATSATDPWISVLIELVPALPFADARAEAATGIDSAQSEGTGFDALRSTILPVTAFVRTSPTVRTTTLVAAGTYNITAQETITDTIPAAMLVGGVATVASPTFTIDPVSAFLAPRAKLVTQAKHRAAVI